VFVSAFGEKASQLAAEIGDGLVTMDPSLVKTFRDSGGRDKHIQSSVKACFDADEDKAVQIALELWGVDLLPGQLNQELAVPKMFEDAAQLVNADKVAEMFPCGPDPERHIGAIKKLADAGFDEVYVQQIGPDFDGFFDLYAKTVVPQFARS
jgi:G6PDH family F420-dependent oxidoreductase